MAGIPFSEMSCSIARALDVVGERWSLLILRDAFNGVRRFDDFQRGLGIARNILTDRLESLVAHGVIERRPYQKHPPRYEYELTAKGRELYPVLIALRTWGDRYSAGPDGPSVLVRHRDCGGDAVARTVCDRCGEELRPRDMRVTPGPGLHGDEREPVVPVWLHRLTEAE